MELTPTLTRWRAELDATGYSAQTVTAKICAARLLLEHVGTDDPADLTREDVLDWLTAHPSWAAWTRIKYLSHVSAYLAWAGVEDVTATIRRPRAPAGVPRPVTEHDLEAMLAIASGPPRAWLILGAYAGLRAHESAKVEGRHLTAPAGSALLEVLGKGAKLALLPVPPIVVDALREAGVDHTPGRLWPDATSRTVQNAVRALGRRVGIVVSSHQLRHRYGTMLYAGGKDLLMTQQLMRHSSPATTAGYALVAQDAAAAAVALLPGAGHVPVPDGQPRLRLVR